MSTIENATARTGSSPKISSNRINVEAIKQRVKPILFKVLLDLFEEVRSTDAYFYLPKLKLKVSRESGACWDLENPQWRNPIPGSDIVWLWERYVKPELKHDQVLPRCCWKESVECLVDYLDRNETKFLGEKPDFEAEDREAKILLFEAALQDVAKKHVRGTAAKFAKLVEEYSEDPGIDPGELRAEMRKRLRNWAESGERHLFEVKRRPRANRNVVYTLRKTGVDFPDPRLEMLKKRKNEEEAAQKRREEWTLAEEKYLRECYQRSHKLAEIQHE